MKSMNMQALIDGLGQQWQKERAKTQMTLGKLIAHLEELPDEGLVAGITNPHSYRGYYIDLAFEYRGETATAREVLEECRSVMGKALEGYKGGLFVMGEMTPVWIARWGVTGSRLMEMLPGAKLEIAPEDSDESSMSIDENMEK